MVLELKFDSISELAELQRLAVQADKPVYIANEDDSIRVDARSFLGLFALDYSKPLKVITDSLYAMRMLEIQQRNRANKECCVTSCSIVRCWCEICTCRPALSSEGERHHGPPGVLRRPDHLCHHGVYSGGQPSHSGRRRHGPGRGLYASALAVPCSWPCCPTILRPGPGPLKAVVIKQGLLADGASGGPALHCPLRHFGAGGHLQLHPPASKAGRHLGRPVHPLHRPSES